ncbi:MAG: LamG-like jellyroll fold domain-containing protein [Candidatus Paceibacterota bacterium]|jgi:fibronectin type 3 domain-containing protein
MIKMHLIYDFTKLRILFIGLIGFMLFFIFVPTSFASTITQNEPLQDCLDAKRVVDLSWSSDIPGNPTYYVMRKLSSEINYSEIGNTEALSYTDNSALSDKSYHYKIKAVKSGDIFSNEKTSGANYCAAVFSEMDAECKANGPHNSLTWSTATGNILKYEILRKNDTLEEAEFVKIGETTDHVYDDGPNIIGTNSYSYSVRANWQDGTKKNSASVSIEARACPVILSSNTSCNSSAPGGQKISLSWNSLMGAARYEIYRKTPSDPDYSLLMSVDAATTTYDDSLVGSMPLNYWQSGNMDYFIKAVWIKDLEEVAKNSLSKQTANYYCSPFASSSGMCDASGNPEMHVSWTKIMNSDFYNLFRNDTSFLGQYGSGTNSFVDYLSPDDCPGANCTQNYKVVAGVTGYPNFTSNTVSQSINCATIVPPSPTPVLNSPEVFCASGDSRIRLSWTSSENVIYYTLYRNGTSLLNLTNTTYIDSGVEAGSEYTYYVIANGREGTQTAPSMAETINASNCIPPNAPILSIAGSCVLGNPKVGLSWSSTSNTINYEIKRGLSEAGMATKATVGNTTYSWNDTDSLNPSTAYYYQVIANGDPGVARGYSAVQSITTDSCLPTLPVVSLLDSCSGGNPKVTISWISDDANTQNFKVFREDLGLPIATVPVGGTYSIIDPNPLLITTTYKYKVVAAGYNAGQEASSVYQPVTTSNCSPPGPFILTDPPSASCQGPYPKVQLDWTNSANATSYDLLRSVSSPATINGVISPFGDVGHGNILNFDGSDDYVNAGTSADLDMTTNDFTVEVWAKADGGTYGRGIVNKGGWGSTGYFISEAYSPSNRYSFGVKDSSGYKAVSLPLYETWGWTHIVGIKKTNHLEAWVNGSSAGEYNGTINTLSNPTKALEIGRSYNPYYFNGSVGEVRIYRRALSSTEVAEHKNGVYANEADLVGLWYFDEGGGQIASDSSNYGRNATLGSAAGADSDDPAWGSGLLSKTNYSWRVDAFSSGGSASSNTISPFLTPECPPQRSNLVLSPLCSSNKAVVDISWPYAIDTSTYEIYRNGVLVRTAAQSIDPDLRKWTDDNAGAGLSDSTNYTYYIKSISPSSASSQSANRVVTTVYCAVLSAPTGLTAAFSCTGTPASTPRVSLSWNAVPGAASYDIYRNGLFLVNETVLTHEDTTVTVNTLYDYTVRAKNSGGESSDSSIASISLGKYCTPQKPVVSLGAGCSGGNPANNISWTGETYPNTAIYKIYRGTTNNFVDAGTVLIKTIDKATQPAAFGARTIIDNPSSPRLEDEATYYYWVQSIGPAPMNYTTLSDATNIVNLFCGPPESTNTLIGSFQCSGTPPSNPYAHMSWLSIGHATSYDVYRNGIFLTNVTTLTHDDYTIDVNTAYGYTVRGRSPFGQGADSNVISIAAGHYCTPSVPAIDPIVTVCESDQSKNTVSWTDATPDNTNNFEIYRSTGSVSISNFESVTFTPPGWTTGGDANWFRDTSASSDGSASAASGAIGNSQSAFIDYDITVSSPSALRFHWKVSSEDSYDFLLFCLDNDGCTRATGYRNRISGTSMASFAEMIVPISAGAHSFRWVYAKDDSTIGGSDRAWIDNVRIVSIDSAALLQTVGKNTLTWTDNGPLLPLTEYLYWIKANGPTGLLSFSAGATETFSCEAMPPVASLNASFACSGSNPYAALGWDNVPNATSYNIYRDGSYLTSRTTNSYDDMGIAVNTAYSYVVKAENDAGEGAGSNVALIGIGNYCVPFTPVIDPIYSNCSTNDPYNMISWSDDFPSGTQKYEIYRNTIDNMGSALLVKALDKTIPSDLAEFNSRAWTDSSAGLQDLWTYYYWIKAIGPTALTSFSSSRSVTTLFCGVPDVSTLALGSTYCDLNVPYADLSWTASANAYSYNLYRNNVSDSLQSVYFSVRSPITDGGSRSLQFDGSDDYAAIANESNFDFERDRAFSITAWLKPDASSTGIQEVITKASDYSPYRGWHLITNYYFPTSQVRAGTISFMMVNTWSSNAITVSTTSPSMLNDGGWHHYVITYDGSSLASGVRIYEDGISLGVTIDENSLSNTILSDAPVTIGARQGGSPQWHELFDGSIDEVRIYGRSLSGIEIAEQYNAIYKNELGLAGVWHFDEKAGVAAYDNSGNGSDGTLINGPERQSDSPNILSSLPLESNKNYKYAVKAMGIGNESAMSNEVSIIAPDCSPVQANLILTPGCDVSGTQIALSWLPDPNTSYWTIYKKRTSEPFAAYTCINCPGTTLTSYIDLNVESSASYDYYIEAHGSSSVAFSEEKTAIAMECFDVPAKPVISRDSGYVCGGALPGNTDNTVLPICAGSSSRMQINWAPYDESKTFSYNILRKNVSAGETNFSKIRENMPYLARTYIDGNINSVENYVYKVEAVGSGVDNSVESDPSLQTTSCDCLNIPPFYPPFLSLVSASYTLSAGGNVEIKWSDTQNETSYEIFRRLQGDSEFAYVGMGEKMDDLFGLFINKATAAYSTPLDSMVSGTDYEDPPPTGFVTFNDLTAQEDTTYEYQIRAVNAAGTTSSNIISPVYVPIAPPGDFMLDYENLPNRVRLDWSAAEYSVKGGPPVYTVYRDDNSDFSSAEVICLNVADFPVDSDNRICMDNDPLPGFAFYRVRAVNNSPIYTDSNTVPVLSTLKWDETTP